MIGNTTLTPASSPSAGRKLAVDYIPIDQLKLDPKNPRLHGRKQVRQIANSIATFGFNVPVLADAQGTVIAGHGRVLAARELGWSEVPTIAIEHLDAAQRRAFAIADNRLTENSAWNDQLLAEQLKELSILDLNFDLEVTGFDMGEIDLRIDSLDEKKPDAADPADQLPAVQSRAVSCLGDLWLLGRHRLLCGNALEPSAYATLMENAKAQLVFTDPPYNVPIQGHVSGLGAVQHREFPMASGEMSEGEFERFLLTCFRHLCAFSRAGSVHFICIDWRHLREFLGAGAETYGSLSNLCVWVKSNGGMGSLYRSRHELIGVFKNGRRPTAIMSSSAALAATAPMFGPIRASAALGGRARKAICWSCIQRSNPWRSSQMPSSTAPAGAILCSMLFWAAAPPSLPRSAPAAAAAASNSIRSMPTPLSGAGRPMPAKTRGTPRADKVLRSWPRHGAPGHDIPSL